MTQRPDSPITRPRSLAVVPVLAWVGLALLALPVLGQDNVDSPWWPTPQRMIQTNLREIDAQMDLDEYMAAITDARANVVLLNVGGIVCNYPTDLEFHWQNTFMKGDLVGTLIKRLHGQGIRVIGRFDFSKINENLAAKKPEWLYLSQTGENVNYNGQVHTCFNGGYQRDYMLEILEEAVTKYPLDGVFFNMAGYQTRDYSGNHHGICQSKACQEHFREFSGLDLPTKESADDPAFRKYDEFRRETKNERYGKVQSFLRGLRPDLLICTYNSVGVDVIRKESNTRLGRGTYHDTEKAKQAILAADRQQLANAAVHFIAIPWRHAAISPQLTGRRLLQHLFAGTWLDFYCIGPFHDQYDRHAIPVVRDVFRFAGEHEAYLAKSVSAAEVGVVARGDESLDGVIQLLCQQHLAFDFVNPTDSELAGYGLIVVPDAGRLSDADCQALDRYVAAGGKLLAAGRVPSELGSDGLEERVQTFPKTLGPYIRIRPEDKKRLAVSELDAFDLVYLEGDLDEYQLGADAEGLLRYVPVGKYGPPEKCYYETSSDAPGVVVNTHEKGTAVTFPWDLPRLYAEQAHRGHGLLFQAAIRELAGFQPSATVDGPALVEINHRKCPEGRFQWVSLLNHSGHIANATHPPVPIHDVTVRLATDQTVAAVRSLKTGKMLPVTADADGHYRAVLPELSAYDVVVFELE